MEKPTVTSAFSALCRVRGLSYSVVLIAAWACGLAGANAASPMTFRSVQIGEAEVVVASGEIDGDTVDSFLRYVVGRRLDEPTVLIDSPGGSVLGSMRLGSAFRNVGAKLVVAKPVDFRGGSRAVPGNCLSACAYAFMGGAQRVVPSHSRLGVHRMSVPAEVVDTDGSVLRGRIYGSADFVERLSEYARVMGVDAEVITYAERIPPESIGILTSGQLAHWHVAGRHL